MRIGKDRTARWAATGVLLLCMLWSSAARAGDRPLVGVSMDGPTNLGVVAPGQSSEPVLLSAFAPNPPGETAMVRPTAS